ncbi:hypothetical protein MmTuc01_2862 [Methanosarcina mazei Tuc01]|uniref:Uncharacterized protein n=1 Tax=Methanosarcina mazei Tuc01 TaxID=1236903 RepID=M1QM77_METMZ|nr:hypothetical protein MmTuc01_2862 [Methanosarcina mazei Tuc01]
MLCHPRKWKCICEYPEKPLHSGKQIFKKLLAMQAEIRSLKYDKSLKYDC